MVGQLQRNEYTRYQRLVSRSRGRVFVLTGTASLFRAFAYQSVADLRGTLMPGPPGRVYDTLALTEDNELTVALKTLGARMVSPLECRVVTEVMTNWGDLRRQRLRWHRGALENIGAYGLTRATAIYWFQQLALGYGVIALNSYFLLLVITLLAADVVRALRVLDRDRADLRRGAGGHRLGRRAGAGGCWRHRSSSSWRYVLVLQVIFVTSLLQIATGRRAGMELRPPAGDLVTAVRLLAHGILLPTEVLSSGWFQALALFVALNTLVFAGLALVKLVPKRRFRAADAVPRGCHDLSGDHVVRAGRSGDPTGR